MAAADAIFALLILGRRKSSSCGMQIKFHPNPKNREKRRALSYS